MSGSTIVPWVIGNWKMNPTRAASEQWTQEFKKILQQTSIKETKCRLAIAPIFIALSEINSQLQDSASPVNIVAQDVSRFAATGAYTGEISADLLTDYGIQYVLIGHSERRELLGDHAPVLADKLRLALKAGLTVIYCVGESLEQREQGIADAVVLQQICDIAAVVEDHQWQTQMIIAYEPIWAIGTGKTASAQDAQSMHEKIRAGLLQLTAHGANIAILYGGSVKPENAKELAACADINGALVGGASLNAHSFYQIADAFAQ
ncbi:triose-phosphate isomerase [Acinetobacter sp. MD2(2019)]|uniref:triose-phosphate isomerase n=1 Tax=Acinetobacter sp. MD2(2019) TaxID=2605273 RepID=UPI002D1F48B6|nr:triose-phosphate isomerase [Acinetobacter sp. MD2(2019)]MEB3754311.1 triose-phosphate isomerase [Acinetobacter sp. MD2(2019)]